MFRSVFGRAEPVSQQQSPGVQQQQQQQGPGIQQQAPNGLSGMESLNPLSRQVQGQAQAQQQQGSGIYGSVPHQQTPGNQGMSGFGPTLQQGVPQGMQQGVQQGMQPGWQQMGPNGIGSSGRKHFPELASLSAEELQVLLTNADKYREFLHKIDEVKQLDDVVEDLQRSNLELAKSTLAMEGTISELQTQCRIIRGTELAPAREQLQQALARQQQVYHQRGPSALVSRVQESATATDQESEQIQAKFVAGEMDTKAFMKEYREKRKLYHFRHQTGLAALASLTQPR